MRLTPTSPVTFGATTLPLREWALLCEINVGTVVRRLRHGWPLHEALLQRPQPGRSATMGWRWDIPYDQHAAAQRFVAMHPGGATLDEIGEFFGVTRERVRQVEGSALRRLRRRVDVLRMMEVA